MDPPLIVVQELLLRGDWEDFRHSQAMMFGKTCERHLVIQDRCEVSVCGAADGVGGHELASQGLIHTVLCH